MDLTNLRKKVIQLLPAIFALGYVSMSAVTYVYIDGLETPVDEDEKSKYEKAQISSIVNLVLSGLLLLVVSLVYFKSMKTPKQYITYF
jgi:hypothetical protein